MRETRRMNYTGCDDATLCEAAQAGDKRAGEYILERYRPLLHFVANGYFAPGYETEDFVQIAAVQLWQAVMIYDRNCAKFSALAKTVAKRAVITALKSATRKKQEYLNTALTEYGFGDEGKEIDFQLFADDSSDPEIALMEKLERESYRQCVIDLRAVLSEVEWRSVLLMSQGNSLREVAELLDINVKSVDNAVQRTRRKACRITPPDDCGTETGHISIPPEQVMKVRLGCDRRRKARYK